MQQSFKDIAQRSINAENEFIESIMRLGKCTMPEAEKVLALYRKLKWVKLDSAIGRYNVKHGAYLDYSAIRNAINY